MNYTPWFENSVKPLRRGLYLLKRQDDAECWHMGYWNGEGWYAAESYRTGSFTDMDLLGGGWSHNLYVWRGLTLKSAAALKFIDA